MEHVVAFALALALLAVGGRLLRQSGSALGLPATVVALAASLVIK